MRYRAAVGEVLAYITIIVLPPPPRRRRPGLAREREEAQDVTYFTQAGGTDLDSLVAAGIITSWVSLGPYSYMTSYNVENYRTRTQFKQAVRRHLLQRWEQKSAQMVGVRARRHRINPNKLRIDVTFGNNVDILNRLDRVSGVAVGTGRLLEFRKQLILDTIFGNTGDNDMYILHLPARPLQKLKARDLAANRAVHNFIPRPNVQFEDACKAFISDLFAARRLIDQVRFFKVSPYTGVIFSSSPWARISAFRATRNSYIARLLPLMTGVLEGDRDIPDEGSEQYADDFGDAPAEHKLGISAWPNPAGRVKPYEANIVFKNVAVKVSVVFDSFLKGNCIMRCFLFLADLFNYGNAIKKKLFSVQHYSRIQSTLNAYFPDVLFLDGDKIKLKDLSGGGYNTLVILRVGDHVKVVDKIVPLVEHVEVERKFLFKSPNKADADTVIFYDLETRPHTSYMRGRALAENAYPVLCSYAINDEEVQTLRSKTFDEVVKRITKKDVRGQTKYKKYADNWYKKVKMIKKGLIDKNYIKGWLQRNYYYEKDYENCVDKFVHILASMEKGGVVYAHNGGRFDHYFVLRAILKYNQKYNCQHVPHYNAKGSQIIKMCWKNWTFKDTFLFIPSSLKDAGKNFNLEQKKTEYIDELNMSSTELMLCRKDLDPWQYLTYLRTNFVDVTDENGRTYSKSFYSFFKEYCEMDVDSLRELFKRFKAAITGVIGKDYGPWEYTFNHEVSTLPSLAYTFFVRTLQFGPKNIRFTNEHGKYEKMNRMEFYRYYLNVTQESSQQLSPEQVSRGAKGLIGGVSFASYGWFRNVSSADIKSCYPWVMSSDYKCPVGRHKKYFVDMKLVGGRDRFDFKRYGYGFALAKVWPDPHKAVNRLPYRIPGQVMSWVKKEPWDYTLYPLYDVDDFLFRDRGKVHIKCLFTTKETVKFGELFGDFVNILKTEKTRQDELKIANSPDFNACLRNASKLILNALSGKFGQGARIYKSYAINRDGEIFEKESNPFANAQMGCSLLACARTLLFTYVDLVATPTRDNILKIETDSITFFASPHIFDEIAFACKNEFGFLEVEFSADRIFVKSKKFSISYLADIKNGRFHKIIGPDGKQLVKIVAKGVHPNQEQMMRLKHGHDVNFNEKQFIVNRCGTLGIVPELSIVASKVITIKGTGSDTPLIGYDYENNVRYVVYKRRE